MWTPLTDRFIDEHLVEMFPLFDQAWLQLVDVMNPATIHTLMQLPPNLVVYQVQVRTIGWPQRWSDYWLLTSLVFHKLTAARSHGPMNQERPVESKEAARQVAVLETEIFCRII